ncbi:hypothetical protein VTK73DRAFT_7974 [Phialemonium thermophilum]|uniref:Uncharacterized protein n=1 Tax=Phialemonium thermophilum TaxID=223376 RepID=A0ABR3WBH5_9PEZI
MLSDAIRGGRLSLSAPSLLLDIGRESLFQVRCWQELRRGESSKKNMVVVRETALGYFDLVELGSHACPNSTTLLSLPPCCAANGQVCSLPQTNLSSVGSITCFFPASVSVLPGPGVLPYRANCGALAHSLLCLRHELGLHKHEVVRQVAIVGPPSLSEPM